MPPASDQDERPQFNTAADAQRAALRPGTSLRFVLTADWVAPSLSRKKIRQWLSAHDWSPAHMDDMVLCISEAVSNSVEHGYGVAVDEASLDHAGVIEVHGTIEEEPGGYRRVVFRVVDRGHWQEPATGPTNRRQGLRIMRACTEEMTIDHTAEGTVVVLRGFPIPMPLPQR